jgi:subtilase family serine protease
MPGTGAGTDTLVETVWNTYVLTDKYLYPGYAGHNAVVGGVDISEPTPSYQTDYGLTPTAADGGGTGRGVPDVSALAGGNGGYNTPTAEMGLQTDGGYWVGTSAAAPMWASLTLQLNPIVADQGLPQLGYRHDLL